MGKKNKNKNNEVRDGGRERSQDQLVFVGNNFGVSSFIFDNIKGYC